MNRRRLILWTCWSVLLLAVAAQATSHVRIVRLSYVDGKVQMDRATNQGLERASLNSPVVEGTRILTGNEGLAEVEFENNSAVRLGEATDVQFSQLLVNDAGDKVNEVELVRGTLYFDTRSGKTDIDRVLFAGQTFVLRHDSQVRFQTSGDQVQAAVFSGEVTVDRNGQLTRLKKDETFTVDSTNPSASTVAKGVQGLPLDRWANERHAYQDAYAYNNYGLSNKGLSAFGFQDLAYYGNFTSLPGYGLVWQPAGANNWAGWNPYMSGAWTFAGGMGYVWSSAYPWGWMPYHYGAWGYQAGMGWFWMPGSSFGNGGVATNWQAMAPVVKPPVGYVPPTAPVASSNASHPMIVVGKLGNAPSYIPDGPVPPNFRSAVTDHSGLVGSNPNSKSSYLSGSAGSTAAGAASSAHNSRAISPSARSYAQTGHVFAPPTATGGMPNWNSGGHAPSAAFDDGWAFGGVHNSARGSGNAMGGSSHATHVSGSTGSHAGSSTTPK